MELTFIQVCSHHNRFVWEVEVMLENYIKMGYTYNIHNIVFTPYNEEFNNKFMELANKYVHHKNIQWFFYKGDLKLLEDTQHTGYIPLLRPYCLEKHFTELPFLKDHAIFYHDSDILWTRKFPFDKYLNDDINYQSYTGSYQDYDYLNNKIDECIPDRRDHLVSIKPIEFIVKQFGLTIETLKENKANTGGAQSLLKNIDAPFWKDVYDGCIKIKAFFASLNQLFFDGKNESEKELKGWQSWALADMCSLSWNLWKRGRQTRCPDEMDFAFATDHISKLSKVYILHNAGVTKEEYEEDGKKFTLFYKGKNIVSPHKDYESLIAVSSEHCSWYYAYNLFNVQNPILL